MAMELIRGERAIRALKRGAGRLNDGGGLYLLPFAGVGDAHYWRFDYAYQGRRKTLSLRFVHVPGHGSAERWRVEIAEQLAEVSPVSSVLYTVAEKSVIDAASDAYLAASRGE